jgi:hypothetical protein
MKNDRPIAEAALSRQSVMPDAYKSAARNAPAQPGRIDRQLSCHRYVGTGGKKAGSEGPAYADGLASSASVAVDGT